ncbi:MAG TPA: alpha/beta fold hydrolase, partial [Longimicrobiales bacterium]|nr:alpha/beta fold hydrolase [Longimicrobiales bacterium]
NAPGAMSGGDGARLAGRHVRGAHASLRVRTGGTGEPALLFLHSLAGSGRQWTDVAEALAPSRRVVVLDLAGHGRSGAPADGRYSLERAAEDVVRVLDALALRRVVLVGHSFGGGVAALVAAERPAGTAGLFLLDAIGDGVRGGAEMRAFLRRLRQGSAREALRAYWRLILEGARPDTERLVLEDFEATSVEVILSCLASTAAFDGKATLAACPGPMRALVTPLNAHPTSLHRVVPELPAEEIEGASHWVQMDRPDAVTGALERLLEEVGR